MKRPAAALCVFIFAAWTLAAPVLIVDKMPSQSGDAVRQMPQQTGIQTRPKPFFSLLTPSRISIERHPNILVTEDGRRIQLPDNLAGAKAWETPNVLHFLTSLTHPKKLSPFPESSIIREETRANAAETEPQESIVELETKAERESWTYIPYISQDNVLHFHCVRKAADTVMLAIPLAATVLVLATALWSVLRYLYRIRFRGFGIGTRGAIRLEDEEEALPARFLQVTCHPCVIQHSPMMESYHHTIDEKSEET
ncbi:hypothetical protein F4677DRAFT_147427 [Hypoxylon crocopeplum]|nr:hypothetical protein F4677DRAFT_147427 [Hypoxylon crocopeplum]